MRGVNRHVEWGPRREPSPHARRGGGRVKRKWSTVKIVQQDGESPMRPTGQTPSAENNGTPNPEVKRKVFAQFAPFDVNRGPGNNSELASIRKRREDRRLHDQLANEAAKKVARVESCKDETFSKDECLDSTEAIEASNGHSSPLCSPYSGDFTPGSSQAHDLHTISSPLSLLGSDSDDSSVRSTWRDWRKDITPPPPLTSIRIFRQVGDTKINHSERVTGLSEQLEMCERGFCSYCGASFSNASAVQVCTGCNSIGTVRKPHLIAPGGVELESSINHPEIRKDERHATNSRTPRPTSDVATPDVPKESFENAMRILDLGNYHSVDLLTLKRRLRDTLDLHDLNLSLFTDALDIIVKHQEEHGWELRLRWTQGEDDFLRSHRDDFDGSSSITMAFVLAQSLETTIDDCRERLKQLETIDACKSRSNKTGQQPKTKTSTNEPKKEANSRATTLASKPLESDRSTDPGDVFNNAEAIQSRNEAAVWSDKEDRKLLTLKKADKSWKTRIAKEKEPGGKDVGKKKGPVSTADVVGSKTSAGRTEYANQDYLVGQWGNDSNGCDLPKPPSVDDGWVGASCWSLGSDWGEPNTNAVPKPEPAPYKPCRVTYWANIESGTSTIKIPIASKYVSGPEKTIATQELPKVWRWVHDKGLGDKVGLQDAFDLARSMHKNDVDDGEFMTMGRRAKSKSPYRHLDWSMEQGSCGW
jgi:hypothetical protein